MTSCRLGYVILAAVLLSACGGGDSETAAGGGSSNSSGGSGSTASSGAGNTTPDGLVVSHLGDNNDCVTYYGKAKANILLSELGPCPQPTGVVCAKCENQYPIVTFTVDGIRWRDEIYARASVEACVSWADGSRRADECEIEWDGKFTAIAPGVAGPSGLSLPAVVPGTPTDGIGPWQFSLLGFKVTASGVTLPDCTNYYGNGVTDDMRWRGDTVPCPDANRVRTAPKPFVIDDVTAERVYYAE
jgi:hypothetical protein